MLTVSVVLIPSPVPVKLVTMVMASISVTRYLSKTNVLLAITHVISLAVYALTPLTVMIAHVMLDSGIKIQEIQVVNAMGAVKLSTLSSRVAAQYGPLAHLIPMQSHKVATNGYTNATMVSSSSILIGTAGKTGLF